MKDFNGHLKFYLKAVSGDSAEGNLSEVGGDQHIIGPITDEDMFAFMCGEFDELSERGVFRHKWDRRSTWVVINGNGVSFTEPQSAY